MRASVCALALPALCILLASCGAGLQSGSSERPLRADDVDWVRAFRRWRDDFDADVRAARRLRLAKLGGRAVDDERYRSAVMQIGSCKRAFAQDVRMPLARRLREL